MTDTTDPAPGVHTLGLFEFNSETGELSAEGEMVAQLAPQPAQLLALLAEHRGELVTHELIRERLWPDSRVEYDQGVHFCVSQIRSALGDSAKTPRFIETLPRRGYRLLPSPEPAHGFEDADAPDDEPMVSRRRPTRAAPGRLAWTVIVLVILAGVATAVVVLFGDPAAREAPVRLAIMPFVIAEDEAFGAETEPIGTYLVAELGDDRRLDVVGPTTTEAMRGPGVYATGIARDLNAGYMINTRLVREPSGQRLLVEIIRTSDGAHVWVHFVEPGADAMATAALIAEGMRQELVSPKPPSED